MTKKPRGPGRKWVKGQSGNPAGGPGLPGDLRDARRLNQTQLERVINELIWMNSSQLAEKMADPALSMFERFVGKIIQLGEEGGDDRRLEFILCRIIGKVQDKLEVRFAEPFVIFRPSGDQVEVGVKPKEEAE